MGQEFRHSLAGACALGSPSACSQGVGQGLSNLKVN